eukprot:CAMPEP_0204884524 /NCGR_PEP_ID=MMETSP1349-20130617/10102_1 /ASSEMBLY_ACC=CAM_ASM_000710 /TAXON_ID=215587 /ORGANISM="Aplanochytrium stocchinoi, Strain GSBS06" /LENGTH=121 /DNA_ID=CAMNT_0052045441 /DNA_START=30 /DNA_END=392 /DNA_ORIENTATION=+
MAAVDINLGYFKKSGARKKHKNPKFYEVVLCRIIVDKDGNHVEFKPALSSSEHFLSYCDEDTENEKKSEKAYRFRTPSGSVYEYSLVNEAESTDPGVHAELRKHQREQERRAREDLENRIE